MRIMGGRNPCDVGCGGLSSSSLLWLSLPVNAAVGCINNGMADKDGNEKEGEEQMAVAANDIVDHHCHHHPPPKGGKNN